MSMFTSYFINLTKIFFNQNQLTMKKMILLLCVAVVSYTSVLAQTARLQAVHNSPNTLVANIDVWAVVAGNSQKVFDDFAYRTASPFINVVAGLPVTLAFAPANSTAITDTFLSLSTPITFTNGESYYLIAYGPNVNLTLISGALETSPNPQLAALAFSHGVSDAPAVDVNVRGIPQTVFDNIAFGDFDGYVGLPAGTYLVDVYDSTSTTRLKTYYAPLATAVGSAALVFASGYFAPASGQPAFAVFAALPSGMVIQLPEVNRSNVQIIHNSADAAAASVDLYVTNDLVGTGFDVNKIDNLEYRHATPLTTTFIEYLNGSSVTVGVAPASSTVVGDTIFSKNFSLTPNIPVTVIAAGHVSTSGYSPLKPFDLHTYSPALLSNGDTTTIAFNIFHGGTDAPMVDVEITAPTAAAGLYGNDLEYGDFSGYSNVPFVAGSFYTIALKNPSGSPTIATSTPLPLGLNPQARSLGFNLYVTGYVSPSVNSNGQSLQVCAASPAGNPVAGIGLLCFDLVLTVGVEEKVVNQMIMYPNPTSNKFNIEYNLESAQEVSYNVYNTVGQLVFSGNEGTQNPGRNSINFDVANLSTGTYIVQVLMGNEVNIKRPFIKE